MESALSAYGQLFAVAFLILANGFFVAAEFALVAVRKTRIEELAAAGNSSAHLVQKILQQLDRYIAGTQVGITLASLALGWIGEPALADFIEPILRDSGLNSSATIAHTVSVGIAFTIITFLHVILGELVPKSLALQKPEATSLALARPMKLVVFLFQPLIWSLNGLGNMLLRLLGLHQKGSAHESVHSAQELDLLVRESYKAGILDDLEKQIFQRAFRFSDTSVLNVMVPRAEIVAFDISKPLDELIDFAVRANHSRLPVYKGKIDRITGFIYAHELFRLYHEKRENVSEIIRPGVFVPETMHLDQIVEIFRAQKTEIAIVIDEYGGTAGLLTLKDVIEAVFGEIQDQDENEEPEIQLNEDGSIAMRGDIRLIDLNDRFGWGLKSHSSDTIAGLIMERLGRIPKIGEFVDIKGRRFRVVAMQGYRVTRVTSQNNNERPVY